MISRVPWRSTMVRVPLLAGMMLALACNPQELAERQGGIWRLSIATGWTGGVYYPYGGGIAKVISEHLDGVEATAEVTAASVDNLKFLRDGTSDIVFTSWPFRTSWPSAPTCQTRSRRRSLARCSSTMTTKIGVSLPDELIEFADREAERRGTSRSALLAWLLEAERVREQTRRYLDNHGWDVADDETAWRTYQQCRMAEDYSDDEW